MSTSAGDDGAYVGPQNDYLRVPWLLSKLNFAQALPFGAFATLQNSSAPRSSGLEMVREMRNVHAAELYLLDEC